MNAFRSAPTPGSFRTGVRKAAAAAAPRPGGRRAKALDLLLGTDPKQRHRLTQSGLAMLLVMCSVLDVHALAWAGLTPWRPVAWWTVVVVCGFALFFAVIRSGRNLVFADPSLTLPQMGFAICCSATGYALAGPGRSGAFVVVMGVFMVGMYSLTALQVWRVGQMALAVFGGVMLLMTHLDPAVYVPEIEWSHFFMLAIMVPTVTALTAQLCRMRERLRRQKQDLATALARIQDLATRDELTGLINRRHMVELLEQERHRGVRSGQTFCVALIDIDDLPRWIERHGDVFADRFLQSFAREALDVIRISDLLSRWGRGRFLLMLSDTRTSMARLSVERLRERIHAMPVDVGGGPGAALLKARLSVGVAEHRAGESVAQTLERAEQALDSVHAAGGNRVVQALA